MSVPLICATNANKPEAIQILLNNGANINSQHDDTDRTALHYATRKGFIGLMTLLLNNGADPNIIDKYGMTPLLIAITRVIISNNNISDMISLLVSYGADMKICDHNGQNLLHLAVMRKDISIIKLILSLTNDRSSLLNKNDYADYNPLLLAIHYNAGTDIIRLLYKGTNSNVLHGLAYSNHFKEVKLLIDDGHDPNEKNNSGLTPLHIAIISKNYEMMQLLIDNGANVHIEANTKFKDAIGNKTPFQLAKDQGVIIHGH